MIELLLEEVVAYVVSGKNCWGANTDKVLTVRDGTTVGLGGSSPPTLLISIPYVVVSKNAYNNIWN